MSDAAAISISAPTGSGLQRRLKSIGLPTICGLLVVVAWIAVAISIQYWAPYSPLNMVGKRLMPPSGDHWLGTDALGRDILTRTLFGASESIPVSIVVVFFGVSIGVVLGAVGGFIGGIADAIVMRAVDLTLAFPPVLLAMAVTASLGAGIGNAAIAMVIVWWPIYARLMRAQVVAVKNLEHVEAAIAGGATWPRLLLKHILPLCWSPIMVNATMDFGQVVLLFASLSFIGLGAPPPTPEWGAMISEGAKYFQYWWVAAGPGFAILSLVLGFNFVGDGLRDLLDPRGKE